ncbi:RNA polymerase sigma factor [Dyadobacter sp. CY323]|uniref:RNA polymerase sigma factor n=1 Tax=Dyadobacter sp. CY323 TaxID=2907302 RepID=UPI001F2F1523|nr:sigma-70 family RNA polymerase sigma factor [Dyadobacter sp. CY323]MCE6987632.1 sigma-70 family RNA polymerase sigma factor [Dyadobacter sp. CY323]
MKFLKVFQDKKKEPVSEGERLAEYRRTGDVAILGSLYEPYMEMVYMISLKYLKEEDESKDAVMQIFEKLIGDLKSHQVENFKSWLHSVVRNHCLMQIRTRHVFVDVSEFIENGESPAAADTEFEDATVLDTQLTSLSKCMESLASEQRISIELFYKQEKCYKEISGETGFDINKVKSYIQNGKRNLKICMDKNGNH